MSQNRMRFVGFFQSFDFILREFDVKRSDGLIEVIHPGRADDGAVDIRFAQYPRQCDLGSGYVALLCNLGDAIGNPARACGADAESPSAWRSSDTACVSALSVTFAPGQSASSSVSLVTRVPA